jgi:hypothetical protein
MTNNLLLGSAIFVLGPLLSYCTMSSESAVEPKQTALAATSETVNAYVFEQRARDEQEITERASALTGILTGTTLPGDQAKRSSAEHDARDWSFTVDKTVFAVNYDPTFDRLTVLNTVVTQDSEPKDDIGQEVARQVFKDAVEQLRVRGIVPREVSSELVEERHLVEGGGRADEPPSELVKEYWFYAPLIIDSARVRKGNQEAGARIAVNRDGRLASLRVVGPQSWALSQTTVRNVSDAEIETRLWRDFPNSEVRRFGLNYVLDDIDGSVSSLPRVAYYVGRRSVVGGVTVTSRAQVVSFAVDDIAATYRAWPAPNPNSTSSDRRPMR